MNIRFIYEFSRIYGIACVKRGMSYAIGYMVMPISLLFLFAVIGGVSYIPFAIVGGLISITASNALSTLGDAAYFRISLKIQDLLVATDISPTDYLLGNAISNLFYSIPGMVVYVIAAFVFHLFPPLWLIPILGILFVLTIATSSLAFIMSSVPRYIRNVWGLVGIVSVVFTLIPPIYYSYTILPAPLLYVFMLSPATPAGIMLQNISNLAPYLWYALPVLLMESIVYLLIAKRLTRWRSV